ncbi:alpha/beta hydrolase [Loigolactobacillus backii]|uniref:alpha/beta hydrolase n=1 Tax=Loigolactobacillus backii TaxID=375175 RepID=UPI0007F15293|nr:alpha/beta hydrolase [Loigolactobacillus backii]ANK60177.1 esterase [Loigolactobacillus backii]ANK65059.1 esterase [Loigolactobacillus backii]ANK67615.1 esterase [Loigolactobacillus backii]MDA5387852.1 alpha/beta hydrolase [Loigolactobacillus backii]MDA5390364.1 alpha/beta hydrolase [Loigolactobacillus backii]
MKTLTLPLPQIGERVASAYLQGYVRELDPKITQTAYPALIIVPGGSYTHIPEAQAETMALAFAAHGLQVFYLRYHFIKDTAPKPLLPQPIIDLGAAVLTLRQHASEFRINPTQIIAAGFSVGGHIVSLYADYWQSKWLTHALNVHPEQLKLAAAILSYPVIRLDAGFPASQEQLTKITNQPAKFAADEAVTNANPPTFIWHTMDDPMVPVSNSLRYLTALYQQKIPVEAHFFHHGPHGLALANQQTAWKADANQPHVAHWVDLAIEWLNETLALNLF